MSIATTYREQWLAARKTFIGASESAAILGCGYKGQNALTVYASKVTDEPPSDDATDAMIIGSLIEPGLVRVFEHFQGMPATLEEPYRVRRHLEYPFIAATMDAWAWDMSQEDSELYPLELKNVDSRMMHEWSDSGECPLKFQVQVSHQMLVTGSPKAYLMGLIGGNKPVIRELHRNDRFIGVLQAKLIEFWGFVERREMPRDMIDWASDATSDALKRLHPDDNGETVVLGTEAESWLDTLFHAKEEIKRAESIKSEAENRLRAAIGDNTFGVFPNGKKLSLKTQSRDEYVCKASKFRVLRTCK